MSYRAVTIALPACEPAHPPKSEWPDINLIRGICPACMTYEADGKAAARMLVARRLVEAL